MWCVSPPVSEPAIKCGEDAWSSSLILASMAERRSRESIYLRTRQLALGMSDTEKHREMRLKETAKVALPSPTPTRTLEDDDKELSTPGNRDAASVGCAQLPCRRPPRFGRGWGSAFLLSPCSSTPFPLCYSVSRHVRSMLAGSRVGLSPQQRPAVDASIKRQYWE